MWSDFSMRHPYSESVPNVERKQSIVLYMMKIFLNIHVSLELHGGPWELMIGNTSSSGGGE